MKLRSLTIITLITFTFAGSAMAQASLSGRDWALTYLRGTRIGNVKASLNIDAAGKKFTGNTGCNIMNGSVHIDRTRIGFNTVITTKRACTRETAPVESSLLSTLGKATRYQITNDRLRLYAGRLLVAEFRARSVNTDESEPPNPTDQLGLEDRKWILDSVAGAAIPHVEQEAFIVFDPAKGSAGGDSSCNAFGGDYKVNGDKISITGIISTMRACIEDERMNIERDFLDGLRSTNRYEVRADKLMLYHGNKLLLTFVGRKK
jgi:heat shock protein HslJ